MLFGVIEYVGVVLGGVIEYVGVELADMAYMSCPHIESRTESRDE